MEWSEMELGAVGWRGSGLGARLRTLRPVPPTPPPNPTPPHPHPHPPPCSLGREVCGFPRIVHGGLTAAIIDESFGGLLFALKQQKALPFW